MAKKQSPLDIQCFTCMGFVMKDASPGNGRCKFGAKNGSVELPSLHIHRCASWKLAMMAQIKFRTQCRVRFNGNIATLY